MVRNLLLIGGAGFIGMSLHRFIYSTNFKEKFKLFVLEPEHIDTSRVEFFNSVIIKESLSNTDAIYNILKTNNIHIVIHLASTLIPSSSQQDFQNELQNIIIPSVKLIQLCSVSGIKFIYFSSGGTVYGNTKTLEPIKESYSLKPISYYIGGIDYV